MLHGFICPGEVDRDCCSPHRKAPDCSLVLWASVVPKLGKDYLGAVTYFQSIVSKGVFEVEALSSTPHPHNCRDTKPHHFMVHAIRPDFRVMFNKCRRQRWWAGAPLAGLFQSNWAFFRSRSSLPALHWRLCVIVIIHWMCELFNPIFLSAISKTCRN